MPSWILSALLFAAPTEDIAEARRSSHAPQFTWAELNQAAFTRARVEHKLVLIDGAAEWCHWCHVMDETTYRDPEVGAWLAAHAIAVRVDVDARPDFAERYGEWGWPATVLLTPDGAELGKFRGYLPPERLLSILQRLDPNQPLEATAEPEPLTPDALPAAVQQARAQLDDFYDPKQGSWGLRRKTPVGMNLQWELTLATRDSLARAAFTLDRQRALIDPIWGGLSQYSGATDWKAPHFEKLLTVQAANLEALALAIKRLQRPADRRDAAQLARFLRTFLEAPDGGFFASQDADLNAHDRTKPFVDGATYHALGDARRRALGLPRIDPHVYASNTGRAVVAFTALHAATGQGLDDARRALTAMARTHLDERGAVRHEATRTGPLFLEDAAWLGLAFARFAALTGDAACREQADRIARHMLTAFHDPAHPALFEHTPDPDAVGVFRQRAHPFSANVTAARLLIAVGRTDDARRVLAGVAAGPRLVTERAWLGDFLLAAHELGVARP